MARKSNRKRVTLLERLYERGEETLAEVAEELAGGRGLTESLAGAIRRAAGAKEQLDQNMHALLSLLNLPSRADYEQLLAKVQALQGSLVSVNMKLDRLLAAMDTAKRGAARRSARPGRPETP